MRPRPELKPKGECPMKSLHACRSLPVSAQQVEEQQEEEQAAAAAAEN